MPRGQEARWIGIATLSQRCAATERRAPGPVPGVGARFLSVGAVVRGRAGEITCGRSSVSLARIPRWSVPAVGVGGIGWVQSFWTLPLVLAAEML